VIHLDTSYVIDLLREIARKSDGPAQGFLEEHSDETFGISVFVLCELLMGAELSSKPAVERERVQGFSRSLHVDFPDDRFASVFARQYARQERLGHRMATMDLLVATSALVADAALLTRDTKDFGRVSGLKLIPY
jgi:tRNA(fMet)-specific endonuclease VapC